ncbi:MAG: C40 family peptidase [Deltaproteobacteria bacterium]|nr:C40 family peptidase [Deltaproteobacteria bacterium]
MRTLIALLGLWTVLLPLRVAGQQADAGAQSQTASRPIPTPSVQDRIIAEAERYLDQPYVFGGRGGRPGCVGKKACMEGIDCLSLIFFAYEKVLGKPWTRYAVKPSITVQRKELGEPVKGLAGVLAADLDRRLLRKGDVLLFLLDGYNLQADQPLLTRGDTKYGVWHTALVHSAEGGKIKVIHAKPGDKVVVEPLDAIMFDGLFALRLPGEKVSAKGR